MKQRQVPGGPYVNEKATAQRQIPGGPYINEKVVVVASGFKAYYARSSNSVINARIAR